MSGLTDSGSSNITVSTYDSGVTFNKTTPKIGYSSAVFNNSSIYTKNAIYFDRHANLILYNFWTIHFWIKTTFNGPNDRWVFGHGSEYVLYLLPNGCLRIWFDASNDFYTTTSSAINDGNWHHVAIVRNDNTGKIFIDGVQRAYDDSVVGNPNYGSHPNAKLWLGVQVHTDYGTPEGYGFAGELDEFVVQKSVLWYDTFTPPTTATTDGTGVILHFDDVSYGVGGSINEASRILLINEADYSIEHNQEHEAGAYFIPTEDTDKKTILCRRTSDGKAMGYGDVTPDTI